MKQKRFLNFDGAYIAYFDNEKESRKGTILFVHGNSLDSGIYKEQMQSVLFADYRLIALDLPGHGESERAIKPEEVYHSKGLVRTLEEFVRHLELMNVTIVANSLAGHIVMNNAKSPELYNRFLGFGYPPLRTIADFAMAALPNPALGLLFKEDLSEEEVQLLADTLVTGADCRSQVEGMIKRSDPLFRKYYAPSVSEGTLLNEWQTISEMKNPVALLAGVKDTFLNQKYFDGLEIPNYWKSLPILLENGSHLACLSDPIGFNKVLWGYLNG